MTSKSGTDAVDVKMSMTSPACPSHVDIAEDIKTQADGCGISRIRRLKWYGNRHGRRSGYLRRAERRWEFSRQIAIKARIGQPMILTTRRPLCNWC